MSDSSSRLRSGAGGFIATIVILGANLIVVPLGAVLVLVWARASNTSWESLGFSRSRNWTREIIAGVAIGIALKFAMKAIVMPLLGAPAINQHYHFIERNAAALPQMIYLSIIVAGFGEETLFRGFLFERLRSLMGSSQSSAAIIVVVTSALFAVAHYPDQGIMGVEQAAFTGLAFGTIYAVTRRLWIPMIAHAAFDLTAVALIYLGAESRIAHLLFR